MEEIATRRGEFIEGDSLEYFSGEEIDENEEGVKNSVGRVETGAGVAGTGVSIEEWWDIHGDFDWDGETMDGKPIPFAGHRSSLGIWGDWKSDEDSDAEEEHMLNEFKQHEAKMSAIEEKLGRDLRIGGEADLDLDFAEIGNVCTRDTKRVRFAEDTYAPQQTSVACTICRHYYASSVGSVLYTIQVQRIIEDFEKNSSLNLSSFIISIIHIPFHTYEFLIFTNT